MRRKALVVVAGVLLCVGCSGKGDTETTTSSPDVSASDTSAALDAETVQNYLAADANLLVDELEWAPSGELAPALLVDGEVIVGSYEYPLRLKDSTFRVFTVGTRVCVEMGYSLDGEELVSSYTGIAEGGGTAAPGEACLEANTDAVEVKVPTENFAGLMGWFQILNTTGTCLDLSFLVFSEEDTYEVPVVVDCSGPHEYVQVEIPDLEIGDTPSDDEITAAADASCFDAVEVWSVETGIEPLNYWYWSPWDWAYVEGDRAVQCVAQVAEDVEVSIDADDVFEDQ